MRARMRFLVALFVALFATPALLFSSAGPSAAMLPRQSGTIPCSTDSSGHDTLSFVSPMTGVAVFDGGGLANVTAVTGGSEHEIDGGTIALATVAGVTHTIHVAGPPSTSCIVLYGFDNTPDNDDVSAAVPLTASMLGITGGSTRAATIAPDEPAPTAGALRVVWYRWTGSTGTATFTAEPQAGGGLTDPASGVTATGVAVYDASNLNAPLAVGGDGIAYQDAGGSGGSATVATTSGTEYLIAVFSAGGTGTFASQHGYPSAGAFILTWSTPPDVRDDVAQTDPGTPVDIAVLANDSDSDGDPLTVTSFATLGNLGSSIDRLPVVPGAPPPDPNVLRYTPGVDVDRYDYFTYDVDDGDGNIVTGLVMVYVGIPIPPPALIQVTPDPIDFGAVPIGKVPAIDVTIKNVSQNEVFISATTVAQRDPRPFDAEFQNGTCPAYVMNPGDECTQPVRFWSITDADAAVPATLEVTLNNFSGTQIAVVAVPLLASTAPAVPPTPNTAPDARDDVVGVTAGFGTHTVRALDNDSDPDEDQIRIMTRSGGQALTGIVRCSNAFAGSVHTTCIQYTPGPTFVGIDVIDYTIADSRGAIDTAKVYVAISSLTAEPTPRIDTVSPNHGPASGGHPITINGANFLPGTTLTFTCSGTVIDVPVDFVSTTRLTAEVPALPEGATCDLAVQTPFVLTGTRAGAYTVDGALPTVLPGGGTIVEGNAGVKIMSVGVRLSAPSPNPVTVQWRTLELTGDPYATGSADYRPQSGQVTFAPNDTAETVQITVNGDLLDEVNEQVWVSWHTATNAVIGGVYGLGYGIIRDDDQPPTVLPGLATIVEGDAGTADLQVPVSLSTASGKPVTVQWTTLPVAGAGFSSPPGDYTPASGVVNFGPGQTNQTVPVVINGDVLAEGDEYVVVSFRNPTNAVMGGFWGLGFGVIDDDD